VKREPPEMSPSAPSHGTWWSEFADDLSTRRMGTVVSRIAAEGWTHLGIQEQLPEGSWYCYGNRRDDDGHIAESGHQHPLTLEEKDAIVTVWPSHERDLVSDHGVEYHGKL